MRNGCANLADFYNMTDVAAMLKGECAKYFQSFASMTREAVSAEVGTSHRSGKYSTGQ